MYVAFSAKLFALPRMRIQTSDVKQGQLTLTLQCLQTGANCPNCHVRSTRIHARYHRHVDDLPCSGQCVHLAIDVRRFRCVNSGYARHTFAETMSIVARYHRRSARLQTVLWHVGLALGGAGAARLVKRLGMTVSGETLLRLLKRVTGDRQLVEPIASPRVLGIDDLAFRRGHHYGTILVDLERKRPIDLVPDRDTKTVAAWLKCHRALHVVTRDRASAYAEAIRQGAPQARQVADRWHLLKNLGDALERLIARCYSDVRETARHLPNPPAGVASAECLRSVPADRQNNCRSSGAPTVWPAMSKFCDTVKTGCPSGRLPAPWRSIAARCAIGCGSDRFPSALPHLAAKANSPLIAAT